MLTIVTVHETDFNASPGADPDVQLPVLQRASGDARIAFKQRGGLTVLKDLYQQGSAKIRLPRLEPTECCEAILINTSGGLTDDDHFTTEVTWRENTQAIVTTQAAERIYRSRGGEACVQTTLCLKEKALGFWIPQETILFDAGRFKRQCHVTMSKGSRLLACESMVFGRAAMGERVQTGSFAESWHVRYEDRLVFSDCAALEGPIFEKLCEPAVANGATAWGTVLYIAENPQDYVEILRKIEGQESVLMACSVRMPVLVIRILGKTAAAMRRMLTTVLETLFRALIRENGHQNMSSKILADTTQCLPRVWYC